MSQQWTEHTALQPQMLSVVVLEMPLLIQTDSGLLPVLQSYVVAVSLLSSFPVIFSPLLSLFFLTIVFSSGRTTKVYLRGDETISHHDSYNKKMEPSIFKKHSSSLFFICHFLVICLSISHTRTQAHAHTQRDKHMHTQLQELKIGLGMEPLTLVLRIKTVM